MIDAGTAARLPEPRSSIHVSLCVAKTLIAIPLRSHSQAQSVLQKHIDRKSVRQTRWAAAKKRLKADSDESATDTDTDNTTSEPDEADSDAPQQAPEVPEPSVKRVFWQRGFSRAKSEASRSVPTSNEEVKPAAPGQLAQSSSTDDTSAETLPEVAAAATEPSSAAGKTTSAAQHELDAKLVAECLRVMTGLYFSHGTDITRSLQSKYENDDPLRHKPRYRSADRRFWFNENLISPFVLAGVRLPSQDRTRWWSKVGTD